MITNHNNAIADHDSGKIGMYWTELQYMEGSHKQK